MTVLWMLKCLENRVKTISMVNWVQKLISTSVPSSVYDKPYICRNVTNSTGGRLKMVDMVKYAT